MCVSTLSFYAGTGDLNSGPCTWTSSLLPSGPSPKPREILTNHFALRASNWKQLRARGNNRNSVSPKWCALLYRFWHLPDWSPLLLELPHSSLPYEWHLPAQTAPIFLSLYAYIIKIKCTISEPLLETKNIVKGLNMMHYFLAKENLPRKTSDCRADGAPAMLGTALPTAARDMSKRLTVFRTGMCWHQKVCRNSSQELGLVCWEVLSSKQWRLLKRFRWEVGARYKVVLCSVANRLCQGQVL